MSTCTCYDTLVVKDLNRWFKEKWVDVSRKDKDGKHPPCGRSKAKKGSKGYPKCRPSVKVSSKTPKTSGSMSEGQKRAATKRKRSKRQGVGGKPTIVKAGAKRPIQVLNDFNRSQTSGENYKPNFTMVGEAPLYGYVNPDMGPQVYGQQGKQGPIYDDENHRALVEGGVFMGNKQWPHRSAPRQQIEIPTLKGNDSKHWVGGKPMDIAWRLLKNPVSPEAKRHKLEYDKQYESNPKRVKYREELNRERRKRGIYGHGGPDMSHTKDHTLVAESPHANRARHFKERGTLKSEVVLVKVRL